VDIYSLLVFVVLFVLPLVVSLHGDLPLQVEDQLDLLVVALLVHVESLPEALLLDESLEDEYLVVRVPIGHDGQQLEEGGLELVLRYDLVDEELEELHAVVGVLVVYDYLGDEFGSLDVLVSERDQVVEVGKQASLVVGVLVAEHEEEVDDLLEHAEVELRLVVELLHQVVDQVVAHVQVPHHVLLYVDPALVALNDRGQACQYVSHIIDACLRLGLIDHLIQPVVVVVVSHLLNEVGESAVLELDLSIFLLVLLGDNQLNLDYLLHEYLSLLEVLDQDIEGDVPQLLIGVLREDKVKQELRKRVEVIEQAAMVLHILVLLQLNLLRTGLPCDVALAVIYLEIFYVPRPFLLVIDSRSSLSLEGSQLGDLELMEGEQLVEVLIEDAYLGVDVGLLASLLEVPEHLQELEHLLVQPEVADHLEHLQRLLLQQLYLVLARLDLLGHCDQYHNPVLLDPHHRQVVLSVTNEYVSCVLEHAVDEVGVTVLAFNEGCGRVDVCGDELQLWVDVPLREPLVLIPVEEPLDGVGLLSEELNHVLSDVRNGFFHLV
jgi:hypothetical protein